MRLRVGARLEPARHQLAAGHQRLRPAGRHRRGRTRQRHATSPRCRTSPQTMVVEMVKNLRDSTGTERVADIRTAMQETMDLNAAVYRTEATLKEALNDRAPAQGAVRQGLHPGQGAAVQHRPARGRRTGLPARTGRGAGRRRTGPDRIPRRARPGGLPEPGRHQLDAPHHGLQAGLRNSPPTSVWTTSRSSRPVTSRWSASTDDDVRAGTRPRQADRAGPQGCRRYPTARSC